MHKGEKSIEILRAEGSWCIAQWQAQSHEIDLHERFQKKKFKKRPVQYSISRLLGSAHRGPTIVVTKRVETSCKALMPNLKYRNMKSE